MSRIARPTACRFLPLILIALALAACSSSGERETQSESADSVAVASADSSAAPADSTADERKRGFFARFRGGDGHEEKQEEAVPVELALVERRDVPSYLGATATLEPEKQVEIHSKATGQIQELLVEEGDFVSQDQVLGRLDGEVQRVALREATLRSQSAERLYRRGEALHENQGISDQEFQELSFRFEEAEAQRMAAEIALEHCELRAPFSGVISRRLVDPGQQVLEGGPVFSIVDADPLLACIFLPEKEAVRIEPGQEVVVAPSTNPDRPIEGKVLRISPVVDTRTGTVKVTCEIPGASRLRPGSFVRVQVQTDLHPDVLVIPKRALVPEGGENYVFKVVADSVIKIGIETGYSNGRYVEILEGLELGEQVVTVGTGSLKMGSKIRDMGGLGEDEVALVDSMSGGAE